MDAPPRVLGQEQGSSGTARRQVRRDRISETKSQSRNLSWIDRALSGKSRNKHSSDRKSQGCERIPEKIQNYCDKSVRGRQTVLWTRGRSDEGAGTRSVKLWSGETLFGFPQDHAG